MKFFRIKRKMIIILMCVTIFITIVDKEAGKSFAVISGIILGISYYRFKKLNKKKSENENIIKEEKEVVTMGKYKSFVLKDSAKAYIPKNLNNGDDKIGRTKM